MRLAALALVALAAAACTGASDAPDATDAAPPPGTAGAPSPGPDTPFCAGVAEIAATLDGESPPDDVTEYLADSYADLIAVAPPELVPDLEALVASLGRSPATTPGSGSAATVPPDDLAAPVVVVTPGEQVADYVAARCGRIDANPGPPPTPPAGGYDTVADTLPATSAG